MRPEAVHMYVGTTLYGNLMNNDIVQSRYILVVITTRYPTYGASGVFMGVTSYAHIQSGMANGFHAEECRVYASNVMLSEI